MIWKKKCDSFILGRNLGGGIGVDSSFIKLSELEKYPVSSSEFFYYIHIDLQMHKGTYKMQRHTNNIIVNEVMNQ